MSRWDRWLSERFTDWLTSPAALVQGLILTLLWLPLVWFGLDRHGFWFLFVATLVSFLTQFPLAYASRRGEEHTLHLMRLLVAMAEDQKRRQVAAGEQLEDIQEELDELAHPGQ